MFACISPCTKVPGRCYSGSTQDEQLRQVHSFEMGIELCIVVVHTQAECVPRPCSRSKYLVYSDIFGSTLAKTLLNGRVAVVGRGEAGGSDVQGARACFQRRGGDGGQLV